jgi:HAD superfamily hydrolase (TIGR01459 family)
MTKATSLDVITGLASVADRYEGFVFDVWGTVYNGEQVFPGVLDVLRRLHTLGKPVLFLSNSPQLPATVVTRLEKIGIDTTLYDDIVTSGGETNHQLLTMHGQEIERFKGRVYQTGPDRFPDTLPRDHYVRAKTIADADWILNAGPNHPPEQLSDYEGLLKEAAARDLPMLCANPDRSVFQGTERHICAGALAELYITLGGHVHHIGKPYGAVFQRCREMLKIETPEKLLMVGDNLETDVLGANRAGLASLLIASGVHELVDLEGVINLSRINDLQIETSARADHVIANLRW